MHFSAPVERPTHCQDNYRVVVGAIRQRDTRRAQAILRAHIGSTGDAYLIACRSTVVLRDSVATSS